MPFIDIYFLMYHFEIVDVKKICMKNFGSKRTEVGV